MKGASNGHHLEAAAGDIPDRANRNRIHAKPGCCPDSIVGGALRRRQDAARDLPPELRKRVLKRIEKEQAKSRGEELFPKLAEQRGDIHVIKDQLPTIFYHVEFPPAEVQQIVRDLLSAYVATLPSAYQASAGRRISSCGGRV